MNLGESSLQLILCSVSISVSASFFLCAFVLTINDQSINQFCVRNYVWYAATRLPLARMGILDAFNSKERQTKYISKSMQDTMIRLWNDAGVVEQLHSSGAMSNEELQSFKKDIELRLTQLNRSLQQHKITPSQIQAWIARFGRQNAKHPFNAHVDLTNRFWLSLDRGHTLVELNHFYSLYPEIKKLLMLREIDKNKGVGFLKFINDKIASLQPPPIPGELERWLRSTALAQYYKVNAGSIVPKNQSAR